MFVKRNKKLVNYYVKTKKIKTPTLNKSAIRDVAKKVVYFSLTRYGSTIKLSLLFLKKFQIAPLKYQLPKYFTA